MDMQMPVMDGLEASKRIRKNPLWNNVPIIAMTANAQQQDRDACLNAGMNGFLAKPIDPHEMVGIIKKWLIPINPESTGRTVLTDVAEPLSALNIEGLDVKQGLKRVLGKTETYIGLLHKFTIRYPDTPQKIRIALDNGDFVEAKLLAHSLKGIAGTIGAAAVQKDAEKLEMAISEDLNKNLIDEALLDFSHSLDKMIDSIKKVISHQMLEAVDDGGQNDLTTVCSSLKGFLENGDTVAAEYLENHKDVLKLSFPEKFDILEKKVTGFDFDAALDILYQAMESATD